MQVSPHNRPAPIHCLRGPTAPLPAIRPKASRLKAPPQGQPPVDNRNEDGKDKGGFNPSNMMNKMPNPMNMFGGGKN